MSELVREYDAKIDSKKRITLKESLFECFHIKQYKDGRVLLEPRILTEPSTISNKTMRMMDNSIKNYRKRKVSKAINLSEFED